MNTHTHINTHEHTLTHRVILRTLSGSGGDCEPLSRIGRPRGHFEDWSESGGDNKDPSRGSGPPPGWLGGCAGAQMEKGSKSMNFNKEVYGF